MTTAFPPPLNSTRVHLWQEHFVCPNRPIFTQHHDIVHKNFISPSEGVLGLTIRRGSVMKLRAGRKRLVGDQIVTKPSGEPRTVIKINDYRYNGQFDVSAFQIQVGERAPCAPYPAHGTTRVARIADGTFPLDDLTPIES